jgi:hypothetical protein
MEIRPVTRADRDVSLGAHITLGFEAVERQIWFRKRLA